MTWRLFFWSEDHFPLRHLKDAIQGIHTNRWRGSDTTAPPKVAEGQGVTTDWEWVDFYGPVDPRTERGANTTAPLKVTEGQGVTTDLEWVDFYGTVDPRTERGVNTTAPPKVTEGQGVTTDFAESCLSDHSILTSSRFAIRTEGKAYTHWSTLRTLWILSFRWPIGPQLESEPHLSDTRLVHSLLPSLVVRPELQRWHMKTDPSFPLSDGDFDPSDRISSFSSFRSCLRRSVSVLTPTRLRLWRAVPVVRLLSRGAHRVTVPLIHRNNGRVIAVGVLFSSSLLLGIPSYLPVIDISETSNDQQFGRIEDIGTIWHFVATHSSTRFD